MKRSFAAMAVSLSAVVPPPGIVASRCLYFEPVPCAEAAQMAQIRGDCVLQDLTSNDAMGDDGCCVDPVPRRCSCVVDGLRLFDIDDECGDTGPCLGVGNSASSKCNELVSEIQPDQQGMANAMAEALSSSTRATSITEEASPAATLQVSTGGLCMAIVAMSLAPFLL